MKKRFAAAAILSLSLLFLASGCAPTLQTPPVSKESARVEARKQYELAFSVQIKRQDRLFGVAFPILAAGKDFCGADIADTYGFTVHDRDSYGKEYRDIADDYFGFGDAVKVRYAHPKLPAALSGLMAGDIILSINGIPLPKEAKSEYMGEKGKKTRVMAANELMEKAGSAKGITLKIERNKEIKEISVKPVKACRYRVRLVPDDSVNAFADGKNVYITSGMMRFTENDEELSLVVGHELAHNAFGHIQKQQGNVLLGNLVDILIAGATGVSTQGIFTQMGAQAYSQDFESEADYAGLYIAARAGYDIKDAPLFWRRMAVEHPGSIKENYSASHPSAPKRFISLENTVKEIEEKQEKGLPLVPEKKKE